MNFSTLRNRRDHTYNYSTPVKKLGFDKFVGMNEDISEKELNEIDDINYMHDNDEKGILKGNIIQ